MHFLCEYFTSILSILQLLSISLIDMFLFVVQVPDVGDHDFPIFSVFRYFDEISVAYLFSNCFSFSHNLSISSSAFLAQKFST